MKGIVSMFKRKENKKVKSAISVMLLTPSFPRFPGDVYSPFVLECARNIALQDVKVNVITSDDKDAIKYNIHNNIKVQRFSYFFPKSLQKLTYSPGGIPEQLRKNLVAKIQLPFFMLFLILKALFNAKGCDIIHSHWVMPGIAGVLVKSIFKKPLVVTVRENNIGMVVNNFLLKRVLKKADAVIINNEQYRKGILGIGVKEEKIYKILNGVNEIFKPGNRNRIRKELNIPDNKKIIIFVGSLIPRKGPKELMEAFLRLKKDYGDLMLVYIGDGVLEEELKDVVDNSKYKADVLFLGKKQAEDVKKWLNVADIFCLPTKRDGIPNVMVEAMACEIPVVVTKVGGIPDIIDNWKNGVIVKPGSIDELYSALSTLILDKDKRGRIGKEGKKALLRKGIDWRINAKRHIKIYKELIGKKNG